MKKLVLLAALVALAALMLAAAPALADDHDRNRGDHDRNHDNHDNRNHDNRDNRDFGDFGDFLDEFCDDSDGDLICDFDEFCEDFDGDFFCDDEEDEDNLFDGFGDGLFQTSDQQAASGDVDQSFQVTGGGANSNQCVGVQGVANTGNAQIELNILNVEGEIDDFELEDLESSLTVDPTNTTTCDQQVNQSATAYGGGGGGYYY